MNLDNGADLPPPMDWNDVQKQNQPQINEMDQLRRQIAVLTEMVQHLQPPSERSDDSDDAQPCFENLFGVPQKSRPVLERHEHKRKHNIKVELLKFQVSIPMNLLIGQRLLREYLTTMKFPRRR